MSNDFFDQRLASLRAELHSYGKDIIEHVTQLYGSKHSASRGIDLKNDPFSMLSVLQIDVAEILQESHERAEYREQHAKELEECDRLVKVLTNVSVAMDKTNQCENLISKASLVPACRLLTEIEAVLSTLPGPNSEIGSGRVCTLLRKEKKLLSSRLNAKMRRILAECVQFEHGRITVHKVLAGLLRSEDNLILEDELSLASLWEAISLAKCTDEAVDDILRNIWFYILRPLWREKKSQMPKITAAAAAAASSLGGKVGNSSSNSNNSSSISELLFEAIVREQSRIFDPSAAAVAAGNAASSEDRMWHQQQQGQVQGGGGAFANLGTSRLPLPQLLPILNQVFSFLWSEMFCKDSRACESACVKLYSAPASIIEALIHSISAQLPKSESELSSFRHSLQGPCSEFEQNMQAFGLLQSSVMPAAATTTATTTSATGAAAVAAVAAVGGKASLSAYLEDLPSIYADLRRKEILQTCRELVLSDYHNTMLAAGDASEDELSSAGNIGDPSAALDQSGSYAIQRLKFDSCQVSLAACRVLKLMHDVMAQACLASPEVAHVLFQSARDCLEVCLAIVPMQFADIIDTVPRMGAVFYNDCLYMAHNCTLITHKYRLELGKVDQALQNTMGFIDFIPRLRQCGERCMAAHLDEQRTTLHKLVRRVHIDPLGTSSSNSGNSGNNNSNGSSSNTVAGNLAVKVGGEFRKAAHSLRDQIGKQIKQQLSGSSGLGIGIGAALALGDEENVRVSNDDEAAAAVKRHMERLSGQWSGVLQEAVYSRLLGHLLDGILIQAMAPLLQTDCIAEAAGAEIARIFRSLQQIRLIFPNEAKDDESMLHICSNWRKFLAITDLLEYSLSEVAEWLPRKKFCFFSGSEMTNLVKALFDDTSRRDGVLTSILEMSS